MLAIGFSLTAQRRNRVGEIVRPGVAHEESGPQAAIPVFIASGRRDSNSGPSVPQTSALTRLRHAPRPLPS